MFREPGAEKGSRCFTGRAKPLVGPRAPNEPCDPRPTRHPPIRRHVPMVSGALDARGDAVRGPSPDRIARHREAADTMQTRFYQTNPNSPETAATARPRSHYAGYPTSNRRPTCVFAKRTQTHPKHRRGGTGGLAASVLCGSTCEMALAASCQWHRAHWTLGRGHLWRRKRAQRATYFQSSLRRDRKG